MNKCEHKFGLKKRDSEEMYCPVCRAVVYEDDLNDIMRNGEGWWIAPEGKKLEQQR